MSAAQFPNLDTIDLQKLEFVSQFAIDEMEAVVRRCGLWEWRDDALKQLVISMRSYVWAEPPKRIECRYPTTWLDAFKERWFPAWAKKKWPVKYTITTLEGQIFYPRLPQTVPENRFNLRLVVKNESSFLSYDEIGDHEPSQ